MKKHATLVAVVYLLGVVGCVHQNSDVTGGSVELIPKSGLLASKGLRVRGNEVKPVSGRTKHTLKVEKLPLSGTDWPYIIEIRFKDSKSGQLLRLSTRQASQTFVKVRAQSASGSIHLSASIADEWLLPVPGGYYYLSPSRVKNLGAMYLSDELGIDLDVQISLVDDLADRVKCSVSIRTGGAK